MEASIGRIVHFVVPEDERLVVPPDVWFDPVSFVPRWRKGDHVAAIVTGVGEGGAVNLQVLYDAPMMGYLAAVPYSHEAAPRSWHWPERA